MPTTRPPHITHRPPARGRGPHPLGGQLPPPQMHRADQHRLANPVRTSSYFGAAASDTEPGGDPPPPAPNNGSYGSGGRTCKPAYEANIGNFGKLKQQCQCTCVQRTSISGLSRNSSTGWSRCGSETVGVKLVADPDGSRPERQQPGGWCAARTDPSYMRGQVHKETDAEASWDDRLVGASGEYQNQLSPFVSTLVF